METQVKAQTAQTILERMYNDRVDIKQGLVEASSRLRYLVERLGLEIESTPMSENIGVEREAVLHKDELNNQKMSSELYGIHNIISALEKL